MTGGRRTAIADLIDPVVLASLRGLATGTAETPQQSAVDDPRHLGATGVCSEVKERPRTSDREGRGQSKWARGVEAAGGVVADHCDCVRQERESSATSAVSAAAGDSSNAARRGGKRLTGRAPQAVGNPSKASGSKAFGSKRAGKSRRVEEKKPKKNPGHSIPPPQTVREHQGRCARRKDLLRRKSELSEPEVRELSELSAYVRQWGDVPTSDDQRERRPAKAAGRPRRIWYREILVGRRN